MRILMPGKTTSDTDAAAAVRKRLQASKAVWLQNTSNEIHEIRSILFINAKDKAGASHHANFPDSFLPICITEAIPPEVLLECKDFWAYINAGYLKLLSSNAAKAILESPEAEEEMERLRLRTQVGSKKSAIPKTSVPPTGKTRFDENHPEDKENDEAENQDININNRVIAICGRLQAGQLSPGQAKAELMNVKQLTREDLGYLIGNGAHRDAETGKVNNAVSNWALSELNKLQTQEGISLESAIDKLKKEQEAEILSSKKKASSGDKPTIRKVTPRPHRPHQVQ